MNTTGTILSLFGASCLFAFSTAAPAFAAAKPCCHTSSGSYQNVTPQTCNKYGGRVVSQRYCQRGNYAPRRDTSTNFSIVLGNVVIGYSDGYYDNNRRWHPWRNDDERNWYQQNRRASYHGMRRDRDNDRKRRDWRNGKRKDWR